MTDIKPADECVCGNKMRPFIIDFNADEVIYSKHEFWCNICGAYYNFNTGIWKIPLSKEQTSGEYVKKEK